MLTILDNLFECAVLLELPATYNCSKPIDNDGMLVGLKTCYLDIGIFLMVNGIEANGRIILRQKIVEIIRLAVVENKNVEVSLSNILVEKLHKVLNVTQ